jgi:iron complex outermembrane receptor protein
MNPHLKETFHFNGTVGFKTETNGWKQDISFTVGGNQQLYSVVNTVNRTMLGPAQ